MEIDLGKPFYKKNTPPPPQSGRIRDYLILTSIIPEPTNCSYVYLGSDQRDGRKKAIKFIKFIKRNITSIINEIEMMKITNHPNIIKLLDYFRYESYLCAVLPFTSHRSITTLVVNKYRNGIPENIAAKLMYQMLKAIEYLHELNIWHRDIKPSNFLLFYADSGEMNEGSFNGDELNENEINRVKNENIENQNNENCNQDTRIEAEKLDLNCKNEKDKINNENENNLNKKISQNDTENNTKNKINPNENEKINQNDIENNQDENDTENNINKKSNQDENSTENNINKKSNQDENSTTNNDDEASSTKKFPTVVLSDFGFARIFNQDEKTDEFLGSPYFMAPEIFNGYDYDKSVDIWSLGITLFYMLTNRYPYPKPTTRLYDLRLSKGKINLKLLEKLNVSFDAIDLIEKMCQFDPGQRITAKQALLHPWVVSEAQTKTRLEQSYADEIGHTSNDYPSIQGI